MSTLNFFQIATLVLGILTTFLVPLVVFLIRGAVRWTRVEEKLDSAVAELKQIVHDKDKVHTVIFEQMKEDRAATDKRLRWLEEYLWRRPSRSSKDVA